MIESKPLAQLGEESRKQLREITEAGMGYYVVTDLPDDERSDHIFIICGDFYAIPVEHGEYFSVTDLEKNQPLSLEDLQLARIEREISKFVSTIKPLEFKGQSVTPVKQLSVTLPSKYTYAFGAIPLLGMITLKYATNFYRYTGSPVDPCFDGTELSLGTYLTPANDIGYANTGFAAVGRYALPIPVPASYQHLYQLDAGTTLRIGTVLPNYGQSGGGVEVQVIRQNQPQQQKPQVTWSSSTKIPDY